MFEFSFSLGNMSFYQKLGGGGAVFGVEGIFPIERYQGSQSTYPRNLEGLILT